MLAGSGASRNMLGMGGVTNKTSQEECRDALAVNRKQHVSGIPDGPGYQGLLFLSAQIVAPVKTNMEGQDHSVPCACSVLARQENPSLICPDPHTGRETLCTQGAQLHTALSTHLLQTPVQTLDE